MIHDARLSPVVIFPLGAVVKTCIWVIVPPLSLGEHDVEVQGQIPLIGLTIHLTHHLTVV